MPLTAVTQHTDLNDSAIMREYLDAVRWRAFKDPDTLPESLDGHPQNAASTTQPQADEFFGFMQKLVADHCVMYLRNPGGFSPTLTTAAIRAQLWTFADLLTAAGANPEGFTRKVASQGGTLEVAQPGFFQPGDVVGPWLY